MTGRTRIAIHGGVATIAAAWALSAVFAGYDWLMPVVGGVLVVVAAAELIRWSPLPSALTPLAAAAGVTIYVTAVYASESAYGGLIPNDASMRALGTLTRDGFDDVRVLATPVPTHDGMVLLAVVGIAAIALVVDLFAVTMRRAALAGLPLLAVFALCTSVARHGAGWIPFVIGTAGYLWLLLADSRDRLSRWGRPLGYDREARPTFSWSDEVMPSPLSVMGRRIGVTAIAVGVVVPLLIPGLRGGVPHGSGAGFGGGGGSSEVVTVNPIVTIRAQLTSAEVRPLMSVATTDPQPGYLRLTSLDTYDGQTFRPSSLEAGVEAQVSRGMGAPDAVGTAHETRIAVGPLDVRWLPVPIQAVDIQVPGDWRYDPASNTVFSARSDTQGLSYTVASIEPQPTREALELATAPTDRAFTGYLTTPDVSQRVVALTNEVVRNAKTALDRAIAIQDFLSSAPFIYDVHIPESRSSSPLDEFLFTTHRGFCQQYATAMAVMARIARIPARVAVGFTRGKEDADHHWTITTRDAHAWPELYFDGFGWLQFEPTPRGDGQADTPAYTLAPVDDPARQDERDPTITGKGKGGKHKSTGLGGKLDRILAGDSLDTIPPPEPLPQSDNRGSARVVASWVALSLLALALVLPATIRVLARRRRWRHGGSAADRAAAAWAELRASALDAGSGWADGLTPRATARVLRAESGGLAGPAETAALDRVVAAVERAWYAPRRELQPVVVDGTSLRHDVAVVRSGLFAGATVRQRIVRHLWPRSSVLAAREMLGRVGQLLDAADLAMARLRGRLRPRLGAG